jgi:hypothetical protein
VATFNPQGELENGWIWLQLKATDRLRRTRDGQAIVVRVERGHVLHWLNELFPVVLVVYDAQKDTAYWLDIQAELGGGKVFQLHRTAAHLTLHVPVGNPINEEFVRQFARRKNDQLARWAEGGSP